MRQTELVSFDPNRGSSKASNTSVAQSGGAGCRWPIAQAEKKRVRVKRSAFASEPLPFVSRPQLLRSKQQIALLRMAAQTAARSGRRRSDRRLVTPLLIWTKSRLVRMRTVKVFGINKSRNASLRCAINAFSENAAACRDREVL